MQPEDSRLDELRRAAEQMGVALDASQTGRLLAHLELLEKWNKAFNLTAIRDPVDMLRQHLLDSLSIVPALQRDAARPLRMILDVGSGAGFPGLPVAVALPDTTVVCIDSVAKKIGFIRQVIAELGIGNASATHARIESMPEFRADVITSRAFASLLDFTTKTRKHLGPEGVWLAMKGKTPDTEIAQLPADIDVFHVEQLQIPGMSIERCLVWMRPVTSA